MIYRTGPWIWWPTKQEENTRSGCDLGAGIISAERIEAGMSGKTATGGMTFELEDGAVTLTEASCEGEAVIPDAVEIDGEMRPVSCIGKKAFAGLPIASVSVPQGTVYIAEEAFSGCQELETVSLPAGLGFIGRKAFYGCIGLRWIDIPEGTQCIGEEAFADCFRLESVSLPDSIDFIGGWAFSGCASLKSASIPASADAVREGTFSDCLSLEEITIPGSVSRIEDWAFFKCMALRAAEIPENVEHIGGGAFSDCISLSKVSIPLGLSSLGGSAFFGLTFIGSGGSALEHSPGALRGKEFEGTGCVLREKRTEKNRSRKDL